MVSWAERTHFANTIPLFTSSSDSLRLYKAQAKALWQPYTTTERSQMFLSSLFSVWC